MAGVEAPRRRHWLVPRFPLEMAIASLATLLATSLYLDLPDRLNPPSLEPLAPVVEKLAIQAPPIVVQARSDDDETSSFMEAVALSHVAAPLPQGEVDRASLEPPPAVQVYARRSPTRERNRAAPARAVSVAAAAPVPAPSPPAVSVPVPPVRTAAVEPRLEPPMPVGPRPAAKQAPARHIVPVRDIGDLASRTRDTVVGGFESFGRGLQSLLPGRPAGN